MKSDAKTPPFLKYSVWMLGGATGLWMLSVSFPDEGAAPLIVLLAAGLALGIFRHYTDEKEFITTLFLAALTVRVAVGMFIYVFDLRDFFGADALTYHNQGGVIRDYWLGLVPENDPFYQWSTATTRPGWGMNYLVAAIYLFAGKSMLAAQSFCAVIGAATAPMVYFCSKKIFLNTAVARTSALTVAIFPAMVIWSCQLLKDGLVIFLLVTSITMVLQLQEKLNYAAIGLLILSLFGVLTIRFYIFYMVSVAVAGSFVVGLSNRTTSIFRRAAVLVVLGLGLTYMGVIRNASKDIEQYTDLDKLQIARSDLSKRAESGFNEEGDVSTAEGAITTIPLGFAYLMFAPFPWQISSVRQAITVPEVFVWWAMIPFMISGIIYAMRHRLRSTFPILFFAAVLTLAYSVFQGNVGTAYRQRTQIQVFLFIFIAVGWELWKEKRADKRTERMLKQRQFTDRLVPERQQQV